MAEYIEREALIADVDAAVDNSGMGYVVGQTIKRYVKRLPAADVVKVVRCKDCIHYHKAHVLCNDGTEKDFSEFPPEAFGLLGYGVTAEYGINVGGKCEIDTNCGYAVDKSVFRQPDDFCSRGERKEDE